jgi:inner membrane protein
LDNLTHTLIGVLVGEAAARVLPQRHSALPAAQRRAVFVTTLAIGSNLPDLDLLYTAVYRSKLDYLLQHRGYTHTLIAAVLFAGIVYALCLAWLRSRKQKPSPTDRWQLAAVAMFGPMVHIGMDATNNYGVHPFWPLDNHWFYGDAIFIIEPLLIASCAPLVFVLRTLLARTLVALALAIALGLALGSGFVPIGGAVLLAAVMLVLLATARRHSPRTAVLCGIAAWAATTGIFMLASHLARSDVEAYFVDTDPQHALVDAVLTAMPANPLCWDVIAASVHADDYVLRRASLSLAPSLMSAQRCSNFGVAQHTTAPLVQSTTTHSASWYSRDELSLSRSSLQEIVRSNCEATAFMQFARMPWLGEHASVLVLGDLRYDREPELGFAEIEISSTRKCPRHSAPWLPPRSEFR